MACNNIINLFHVKKSKYVLLIKLLNHVISIPPGMFLLFRHVSSHIPSPPPHPGAACWWRAAWTKHSAGCSRFATALGRDDDHFIDMNETPMVSYGDTTDNVISLYIVPMVVIIYCQPLKWWLQPMKWQELTIMAMRGEKRDRILNNQWFQAIFILFFRYHRIINGSVTTRLPLRKLTRVSQEKQSTNGGCQYCFDALGCTNLPMIVPVPISLSLVKLYPISPETPTHQVAFPIE